MTLRKENLTYDSEDAPKPTQIIFCLTSFFRDAFFQFLTLFMLLYVQMASPIVGLLQYTVMYTSITLSLVAAKFVAGFGWILSSRLLTYGHFAFGKYRTMIFFGTLLSTTMFFLLYFVTPLFQGWTYVVLFIIFYAILLFTYSFQDIAYWSFCSTLSKEEEKRGRITSFTTFFSTCGSYLIAGISPLVSTGNAKRNFTVLGLALVGCFFLFQMLLAFIMKERKEEPEETLHSTQKGSIWEPFQITFHDKQVLYTILSFFALYIAQDILIGNSTNYFYYEYGFGSFGEEPYGNSHLPGGVVSFFFSICFGAGYAISQFVYSPIAHKLKKKDINRLSLVLLTFAYLFLFFFAFRSGNEVFLCLTAFLLAFGHGLAYIVFNMNIFDVSEEHEYNTGEDKYPAIQSVKSFSVLSATAVQTGILYITYLVSNLTDTNRNLAEMDANGATIAAINNMIHSSSYMDGSLNLYLGSLTLLPLLLSVFAITFTNRKVHVNDEKQYKFFLSEVEKRKKKTDSQ